MEGKHKFKGHIEFIAYPRIGYRLAGFCFFGALWLAIAMGFASASVLTSALGFAGAMGFASSGGPLFLITRIRNSSALA
jgi:hypothetical protein